MLSYLISKAIKKMRLASIKNSRIDPTSKVEAGSSVVSCSFDRYSFCGYDCDLNCVEVGSFVSIANNVFIGGNSHPVNWVSSSPVFYRGRDSVRKKFSEYEKTPPKVTKIGHDVWIAYGAKIKQGVTVNTGAVVGMGSVVTKDVAPYEIVAGNPAKHIRYRFDEDVIAGLLESRWWELPELKLQLLASTIRDPKDFLAKINSLEID